MIYYILHAQHNEHIIFYITINIKQYTRELGKQRARLIGFRRLALRLGLAPYCHGIKSRFLHYMRRDARKPHYGEVLQAARETDHILR